VFVGTAAGKRSAELGHYYAGRGNRFWRTLHEVRLTPRRFKPAEFRNLLALGISLTDMSKLGAGMDRRSSSTSSTATGSSRQFAAIARRAVLQPSKGRKRLARPPHRGHILRAATAHPAGFPRRLRPHIHLVPRAPAGASPPGMLAVWLDRPQGYERKSLPGRLHQRTHGTIACAY
jgi:hypothetical protein